MAKVASAFAVPFQPSLGLAAQCSSLARLPTATAHITKPDAGNLGLGVGKKGGKEEQWAEEDGLGTVLFVRRRP